MSRDKLVDVNDLMHASVNVGCQGKSGPCKIHEVILVIISLHAYCFDLLEYCKIQYFGQVATNLHRTPKHTTIAIVGGQYRPAILLSDKIPLLNLLRVHCQFCY